MGMGTYVAWDSGVGVTHILIICMGAMGRDGVAPGWCYT